MEEGSRVNNFPQSSMSSVRGSQNGGLNMRISLRYRNPLATRIDIEKGARESQQTHTNPLNHVFSARNKSIHSRNDSILTATYYNHNQYLGANNITQALIHRLCALILECSQENKENLNFMKLHKDVFTLIFVMDNQLGQIIITSAQDPYIKKLTIKLEEFICVLQKMLDKKKIYTLDDPVHYTLLQKKISILQAQMAKVCSKEQLYSNMKNISESLFYDMKRVYSSWQQRPFIKLTPKNPTSGGLIYQSITGIDKLSKNRWFYLQEIDYLLRTHDLRLEIEQDRSEAKVKLIEDRSSIELSRQNENRFGSFVSNDTRENEDEIVSIMNFSSDQN